MMTGKIKTAIVIDKNQRIYLKELFVEDVTEDYYKWMHDDQVIQYLESRFSENTMDDIRMFVANCLEEEDSIFLAIRLKENDQHIGNIKIHRINQTHRSAELSIMIGDKSCWGQGYGREAIELLSNYAFNTLNLNKLTAECYATNVGSLNVFKKAGYKLEGTREKQYCCNGQYVDAYVLGLVHPTK